ncbi:MAG TPA: hypothetical protein PK514_15730 [Spirochaetota bacterium]|nr:hypothetical protein [Spirochaetota bacterium]
MNLKNICVSLIVLTVFLPGNKNADFAELKPLAGAEIEQGLFSFNRDVADIIYNKLFGEKLFSPGFFKENHIVAYYGHPRSRIMGIVGRHPVHELGPMLKATAASYDIINGDKGVVPAIYLIFGTCQPGGEINRIDKKLLDRYIEYTLLNGMLLYLDHQLGKYSIEEAINEMLPYLKYPNVHLAFDPEWHTTRPMREIGYVTAAEINSAQKLMKEYMLKNGIRGKRQLVFHQFNPKMVRNREGISASFDPVILVHTTSGWGPPDNKRSTHDRNALTVNIPDKGFKLWFFYTTKKGVHYDKPLMTPEEVLALRPEPGIIIYQ